VNTPWRVAGSYFESCNCDPICPCRKVGRRLGGRSTHGVCEFALSWMVRDGAMGELGLSGREVVLAGWYSDDERGSPWRVVLYVDEDADDRQYDALADIFLGRAGGSTLQNFAAAIGEVHAVHRAHIELDHRPGNRAIDVDARVTVRATEDVASTEAVACAIPGFDHPGQEVRASLLRVDDAPLRWEVTGVCGFATDFDYSGNGAN
jgi:hypothetical protein